MAINVNLASGRQLEITDSVTGDYISNIYTPNIVSFTKLIRSLYANDQGGIPSQAYAGVQGNPPSKKQYIVRMHLNNGMVEDFPLGGDGLPPTWTNNELGYGKAVVDITEHASA